MDSFSSTQILGEKNWSPKNASIGGLEQITSVGHWDKTVGKDPPEEPVKENTQAPGGNAGIRAVADPVGNSGTVGAFTRPGGLSSSN